MENTYLGSISGGGHRRGGHRHAEAVRGGRVGGADATFMEAAATWNAAEFRRQRSAAPPGAGHSGRRSRRSTCRSTLRSGATAAIDMRRPTSSPVFRSSRARSPRCRRGRASIARTGVRAARPRDRARHPPDRGHGHVQLVSDTGSAAPPGRDLALAHRRWRTHDRAHRHAVVPGRSTTRGTSRSATSCPVGAGPRRDERARPRHRGSGARRARRRRLALSIQAQARLDAGGHYVLIDFDK
jgi:hypothetical protein